MSNYINSHDLPTIKAERDALAAKIKQLRKLCAEGGTICGGLENLIDWINRVIAAGREEGS